MSVTELNGSTKPRTVFCRRSALIRWTGWSEKEIAYYVAEGKLRISKALPNCYPRYSVQSAQELIDAIEAGKAGGSVKKRDFPPKSA